MYKYGLSALALLATFASFASSAFAATFETFTPLSASVAAGSLPEATPLSLSNSQFIQQTVDANTPGAGRRGDNWDMITLNENGPEAGRYLFSPYETGTAGVRRVDLQTGASITIVADGTQNFVAGDASRWTPWGTYLTAEESWGTGSTFGRLFEVTNPITTTGPATTNFVHRGIIPRVSHEGLAFDKNNNLYFIDELNGGSIYKFVSAKPNATNGNDFFAAGQTFALKVGNGNNANATGSFTWAAITDLLGNAIPGVSSVVNIGGTNYIDGRVSANNVGATDYQRPEDLEIQTLANGEQVLYGATTTTGEVYSLNLTTNTAKLFASRNTIDQATGLAVGTSFTDPDNLAIDAKGNIYIVEDQPGGVADIWFAQDANRDGVAESVGRWASMSTLGAEPTGLYFDPFKPNVAYLNIQHAGSDVDRTIKITATPEHGDFAVPLVGLIGAGAALLRRKRKQSMGC